MGLQNRHLVFVSLTGLLSHANPTEPVDLCVRLAAQTGGKSMLLPAPFVADDESSCALILSQRLVRETIEVASNATHAIASVGECCKGSILFESGLFNKSQLDELRAHDVVADTCGLFFKADGTLADMQLNRCTPCSRLNDMTKTDIALLAGGSTKDVATLAILRAGFASRLFIDENLATSLLQMA